MTNKENFIINRDMMLDNDCFGCGLDNPNSMGIHLKDRTDGVQGLDGSFDAPKYATAFPNLIHPGAFFTALVCLSVWTPYRLRNATKAVWFLADSQLSFRKAAKLTEKHILRSEIILEKEEWDPMSIAVEALNLNNEVLISGQFQLYPFTPEQAMEIAGIETLPESWKTFLTA